MHLSIKKLTKIIRGRNGNTIEPNVDGSINAVIPEGAGSILHDIKADDWVDLPPDDNYHEIVKYDLVSGDKIYIKQITVSLIGMMSKFRVIVHDGNDPSIVRRYSLSTQQNTFSESVPKPIYVEFVDGAYILIEAKMLGVGQEGQAFAALNCHKT